MATVPHDEVRVTVGVDTHEGVHVAVALDPLGRWLGELAIVTTSAGYARLVDWASQFGVHRPHRGARHGQLGCGPVAVAAPEGLVVVEVDRLDRKTRRHGKSDTIDAEAAARAVLSGQASAVPKNGDGPVEMIRILRLTRRSGVKNRTVTANQISSLVATAPEPLRQQLRGLTTGKRVAVAVRFRIGDEPSTVLDTTRFALRELARRHQHLSEQIQRLDDQLDRLVAATAPDLVAKKGVGTHTAASLLVTAGDNPRRLHHEGSFAHLTGSAPLDASLRQATATPAQPRRRSSSHRRAVSDRTHAPCDRRRHQAVRHATTRRGQDEKGSVPLPQALHRPRGPQDPGAHSGPTGGT